MTLVTPAQKNPDLADQSKFDVPNDDELEALENEVQIETEKLQGFLASKAAATQRRVQLEATPTDALLARGCQVSGLLVAAGCLARLPSCSCGL